MVDAVPPPPDEVDDFLQAVIAENNPAARTAPATPHFDRFIILFDELALLPVFGSRAECYHMRRQACCMWDAAGRSGRVRLYLGPGDAVI